MNDRRTIIGLIGEKGSGKGTVAKHLCDRYGAVHFGTSKILKRTTDDLRLPATRDNLIKLALVLKNGFWPSIVIDAMIAEIEEGDAKIVIADGIRMHGDVEPFRKKYGDRFHLWYVTAPVKLRYERTLARKEKVGEDMASWQEFLNEEGRLTEVSIHDIGAGADATFVNDKDAAALTAAVDGVMGRILPNLSS